VAAGRRPGLASGTYFCSPVGADDDAGLALSPDGGTVELLWPLPSSAAAAAGSLTAALWGAHHPLGRRLRAASAEKCSRTVPSRVHTAATPSWIRGVPRVRGQAQMTCARGGGSGWRRSGGLRSTTEQARKQLFQIRRYCTAVEKQVLVLRFGVSQLSSQSPSRQPTLACSCPTRSSSS
jgi:hypothetical protein